MTGYDPRLPNAAPNGDRPTPFEEELLKRLKDIFASQRSMIEQRPCCVFEDPMWWLTVND